jgi:hypothetical protein
MNFHDSMRSIKPDHVVAVSMAFSGACRDCGSGMHDEDRIVQHEFGTDISAGRTVMVTRKQKVDTGVSYSTQGKHGSTGKFDACLAMRRCNGMMRNEDFPRLFWRMRECAADLAQLFDGYASGFPGKAAGCVQAEHCDVIIAIPVIRKGDRRDVPVEFLQRTDKTVHQVVKRNIVIARDDENRLGNVVDEMAGLNKFGGSGALGQIAAENDKIGLQPADFPNQGGGYACVMTAKVQVGNVGDHAHR